MTLLRRDRSSCSPGCCPTSSTPRSTRGCGCPDDGARAISSHQSSRPEPDGQDASRLDETRVRLALERRAARASCAAARRWPALVVLVLLFAAGVRRAATSASGSYTDLDFNAFLQPPVARRTGSAPTQTGNDLFALTLRGMQKSLLIGLSWRSSRPALAAMVGAFAGYFGGWRDRALMWIVDLLLVLPVVPDHRDPVADVPRQDVAGLRRAARRVPLDDQRADRARHDDDPARARVRRWPRATWACATGGSSSATSCPNVASLLIIDATLNVSAAIIAETGLSFFGFGVQPPDVSLGTLIADGTNVGARLPVGVPVPRRAAGR